MSPESHTIITIVFGVVVALIGLVYRNDQKAFEAFKQEQRARTTALEGQNSAHERELAALTATQTNHDGGFEVVRTALDRLDSKVDQIMIYMGRRPTPYGDGGRKT